MNTLKKKTLNIAVGAALGVAVAAPASADSLLAPLVVSIPQAGIQTFFQVKVQGQGTPDARFDEESDLHYYWYQKGIAISDLRLNSAGWTDQHKTDCEKSNARGKVSPWDMVFQSLTDDSPGGQSPDDFSEPRFVGAPFVGFMILDDEVDGVSVGYDPANPGVALPGKEGQFSGAAYVVSFNENIILDYKLLNNHKSARSGDFGVGFISKKTVDFQWWPEVAAFTEWLVLAVGPDMTQDGTDTPSSRTTWPGKVVINQLAADALGNGDTRVPFGGQIGVYDNDEMIYSGGRDVVINCMALIDRSSFMTPNQWDNTVWGGWTRKNLTPIPDAAATIENPTPPTTANGAIVYRFETGGFGMPAETVAAESLSKTVTTPGYPFGANPSPNNYFRDSGEERVGFSAFQIETSGHLNGTIKHPNRPY